MYAKLKQLLKRLIPGHLLFRFEPYFRSVYALFYLGGRYQCNICGIRLRTFISLENGDRLCPKCGSISRNRRLWQLLRSFLPEAGGTVLDFSPSRCLYRAMKRKKGLTYISTDISGDFIADQQYDITAVDLPDDSLDLIICYHILEHIREDRLAMDELYRVLRPGGHCLVQTPFREGDIYEDPEITSPEERLVHFGQEDHLRVYSVKGLEERLQQSGFKVEVRRFSSPDGHENGFSTEETVFVLKPGKAEKNAPQRK